MSLASSNSTGPTTTVDGGASATPSATSTGSTPFAAEIAARNYALKLVFNQDIVLLAFFSVFVLLSLPRAWARVANCWSNGHILRSGRVVQQRRIVRSNSNGSAQHVIDHDEKDVDTKTDDSHTLYSHTHLINLPNHSASTHHYPTHIRRLSSLIPSFITSLTQRRVSPGYSIGQALLLAAYGTIMNYATSHNSNIFTDPVRSGYVAMSQVPFVFAFAMKNNVLGGLVGLGYEKMNFIHRFVGASIIALANIHTLGYIYAWSIDGTFKAKSVQPSIFWGFVAVAALDLLALTSLPPVRRASYRLFYCSHVVCIAVFLPAVSLASCPSQSLFRAEPDQVCAHKPIMIPYVLGGVMLYGLDHFVRVIKSRIQTARIRPLAELGVTRVEVPELNKGWRAGQHIRLRVLSSGMGWTGWAESHPFTIASVGNSSEEGLVLLCKKAGKWTDALYEMAKVGGYGEKGRGGAEGKVRVVVEGPYGGPGYTLYSSYSAAAFVCGGSGISFGLAATQELVQQALVGTSRVRVIELIWTVQDPASLVPLIPIFTSLIQQTQSTYNLSLAISVHYTRATPGLVRISPDYLLPGLSLSPGRPKIGKVLEGVVERACAIGSCKKSMAMVDEQGLTGMVVGTCGPVALGDEVVDAVRVMDARRKQAIGGVEVCEEVFGW